MHSIVLLTAVTATSGLFGGHRQAQSSCAGGSCARPARVASYAPATCSTGNCGSGYAARPLAYASAPAGYAPAPAPATYAPAPALTYNSYYYPTAATPAAACATGTCPRR